MRKWNVAALALAMLAGLACAQETPPQQPKGKAPAGSQPKATAPAGQKQTAQGQGEFKTNQDKISYGFGLSIGRNIEAQGVEINVDSFVRGLKDALAGKDPAIPPEELQAAMQQFQIEMMAKQREEMEKEQARRQEASKPNREKAEQFLQKNKQEQGVKATESGLQYKVLQKGTGESPDANDVVKVHYKGTLLDGTVFDSSYERGEPVTFPLNGVIRGWSEGVQLMQEGGKAKFWLPPDLAYGNNPPPGSPIEPGQLLVFEIELLEVMEQPNPPAGNAPAGAETRPRTQQSKPAQPKQE